METQGNYVTNRRLKMAQNFQALNRLEKDCEVSITKQPDMLHSAIQTFGSTSIKAFKNLGRTLVDPNFSPNS
jgi:hypothetical protein